MLPLGERIELRNISFPVSPPDQWFSGAQEA